MGIKPSMDPKADELWNSNMPRPADAPTVADPSAAPPDDPETSSMLDDLDSQLADLEGTLGVTSNAESG
jgi:hypothetical protein